MGLVYFSEDADYSVGRGGFALNSPVAPSVVHFFDQGAAEGARNLATVDAIDSTIVGSPIENDGFLRLGNNSQNVAGNYVGTAAADVAAVTFLLIARSLESFVDGDHRPSLVGNYRYGDSYQGISLVMDNASSTVAYVEYQNGGASQQETLTVVGQANAQWAAIAFTITPAIGLRLYNLTRSSADGALNTALPRRLASRPMFIGDVPFGYAGQADVAFAAVIPAALSRDQCVAALAPVREYFAEKYAIEA